MYGLKPVPLKASSFPAACEAPFIRQALAARLKSCPFKKPSEAMPFLSCTRDERWPIPSFQEICAAVLAYFLAVAKRLLTSVQFTTFHQFSRYLGRRFWYLR